MKQPQSHKQTLMLNNKNKIHPNSDFQSQNDEQIEIPPFQRRDLWRNVNVIKSLTKSA